jgi:hypothetical protein
MMMVSTIHAGPSMPNHLLVNDKFRPASFVAAAARPGVAVGTGLALALAFPLAFPFALTTPVFVLTLALALPALTFVLPLAFALAAGAPLEFAPGAGV